MRFVANSEKCCKYTFLEGFAQIITILLRGSYRNLLQYYIGGGLANLLQYYIGGEGSSETPKSYYVIYGRPLIGCHRMKDTLIHVSSSIGLITHELFHTLGFPHMQVDISKVFIFGIIFSQMQIEVSLT